MGTLLTAMVVVFVAELGDKTQLAAAGFGARYRLAPVLAGVIGAYMASNVVSVVIGGLLGASLPTRAINLVGGVLFLGFAAWNLRGGGDDDDEELAEPDPRHVAWSVGAGIFVAELGDKTQIAAATLAAQGSPVLVWVGATIGIVAAGVLGVLVGRAAGARLPQRAIRIASTVLFAGVGLVLIWTAVND